MLHLLAVTSREARATISRRLRLNTAMRGPPDPMVWMAEMPWPQLLTAGHLKLLLIIEQIYAPAPHARGHAPVTDDGTTRAP